MVLRALVTLLVTTAPEALGQPLLTSPLLAVIHEDAACDDREILIIDRTISSIHTVYL